MGRAEPALRADEPRGRRRAGETVALVDLIDEHPDAAEYDLLALGRRLADLGTPGLTWREMSVIVEQSPRTSAINRARLGDSAEWDVVAQLLSVIANKLSVLVWLNTEDGAKGRNFPEPILWPGARDEYEEENAWAVKMRGKPESITDIGTWLAKRNPAQHSPRP